MRIYVHLLMLKCSSPSLLQDIKVERPSCMVKWPNGGVICFI